MSMRKLAMFALLAAVAVGCKPSPEKQVQGSWKASDVQLPAQLANNPMASMLKSQLGGATLEVKPDKKYTLSVGGQPVEGDWSITGRSASFLAKTFAGQSAADIAKMTQGGGANMAAVTSALDKPSTLTLSDDGKTLKGEMLNFSFTFTKSEG